MRWFHKHQWVTIARTYKAPRGRLTHVRNVDEELLLQMQYGVTTVTQRCSDCGLERSYVVAGEVGDVIDHDHAAWQAEMHQRLDGFGPLEPGI